MLEYCSKINEKIKEEFGVNSAINLDFFRQKLDAAIDNIAIYRSILANSEVA